MEAFVHQRIHDTLKAAKKPLLVCDARIDGDSLGSALAVADWLMKEGKSPRVFVVTPVPESYRFLPHLERTTSDQSVFADVQLDAIAFFDCSRQEFAAELLKPVPGRPAIINIDHHSTNPRYGDVNQVLTDAPATAEVVHRFFKENGIVPSKEAALCLLAGIYFDTTAFSNGATCERAFLSAAELVRCGGKPKDVIRALMYNRPMSALRAWGTALERLRELPGTGWVVTHVTLADLAAHGATDDDLQEFSTFLAMMIDAPTVAVLQEAPGMVKVSMRSHGSDVSAVARRFGGGGHVKAAGCRMSGVTLEEAEECLKTEICRM
ncbi:hypothetical protein EPO34_04125 [Patescibacteria group bacterium]|nr:MAG: hypothetical protein EPO34_04125 [Patescibacteria group bacterium]